MIGQPNKPDWNQKFQEALSLPPQRLQQELQQPSGLLDPAVVLAAAKFREHAGSQASVPAPTGQTVVDMMKQQMQPQNAMPQDPRVLAAMMSQMQGNQPQGMATGGMTSQTDLRQVLGGQSGGIDIGSLISQVKNNPQLMAQLQNKLQGAGQGNIQQLLASMQGGGAPGMADGGVSGTLNTAFSSEAPWRKSLQESLRTMLSPEYNAEFSRRIGGNRTRMEPPKNTYMPDVRFTDSAASNPLDTQSVLPLSSAPQTAPQTAPQAPNPKPPSPAHEEDQRRANHANPSNDVVATGVAGAQMLDDWTAANTRSQPVKSTDDYIKEMRDMFGRDMDYTALEEQRSAAEKDRLDRKKSGQLEALASGVMALVGGGDYTSVGGQLIKRGWGTKLGEAGLTTLKGLKEAEAEDRTAQKENIGLTSALMKMKQELLGNAVNAGLSQQQHETLAQHYGAVEDINRQELALKQQALPSEIALRQAQAAFASRRDAGGGAGSALGGQRLNLQALRAQASILQAELKNYIPGTAEYAATQSKLDQVLAAMASGGTEQPAAPTAPASTAAPSSGSKLIPNQAGGFTYTNTPR